MIPGDLVRIFKQPPPLQITPVEGLVCVLQEVDEHGRGDVTSINLQGEGTGGGWVGLDCLEPVTDPQWIEAKRKYDEILAKYAEQTHVHHQRWVALVSDLAAKHGITSVQVEEIFTELSKLR